MGPISTYLRQNVLGLVAIFLALNAGAYAVTTSEDVAAKSVTNEGLTTGAVDSRVLATNAVTTPDIAAAAVGTRKIKLGSLVNYLRTHANVACPDGQLVQSVAPDGNVDCAPAGAGTITGVSTSGGLTGGGKQGDIALGVDPSAVQSRITGSCSGNQAVQSVGQGGGLGCQAITATGAAGGDLTGSFPNPNLANGSIDSTSLFSASLQDGAAGTATLRSLGTGAAQAAAGNDSRLSDARTPTGTAGGDLTGTYPNPTLGTGVVDAGNLAALPGGRMIQTSCQTVPNDGNFHQLTFDQLEFGQGVTFNNGTDALTVGTAGTYLVTAYGEWAQNGAGDRALGFDTSVGGGTSGFDARPATASVTVGQAATQLVHLPAGTTLTANAGQTGAANLSFIDAGAHCASLAVQWMGP